MPQLELQARLSEVHAHASELHSQALERHKDGAAPEYGLGVLRDAGLNQLSIAPGLPNSLGAGHADVTRALIEVGKIDISLGSGWAMSLGALAFSHSSLLGPEQKERLAVEGGEHLFCLPISGIDSVSTDPNSYWPTGNVEEFNDKIVIRDLKKMFVSNGGIATRALISCLQSNEIERTDQALLAIIDMDSVMEHEIGNDSPPIIEKNIWDVMDGMRSTRSNQFTFDGVETPKSNILARMPREAFPTVFLGASGQWTYNYLSAVHLGGAKAAMESMVQTKRNGYDGLLGHCIGQLEAAEALLFASAKATDAAEKDKDYDEKGYGMDTMHLQLKAREVVSSSVETVTNAIPKITGVHGRMNENLELIRLNLQLALLMPPVQKTTAEAVGSLARGLAPF